MSAPRHLCEAVQNLPEASSAHGSRCRYDAAGLGRRTRQTTSAGSSGSWQVTEDLKFVSAPVLFGRHIAELGASDNAAVRSYVWGLDLGGSLDGAGGVGGLLMFTHHGSPVTPHFCAYDGNGNVVALVHAADGAESARYEYGPFGEPIRVSGPAATLNPFRFSTKRTDNSTDFVLYEYRPYVPSLGRWPNRDPIGEHDGPNIYAYVHNNPINQIDPFGLWSSGVHHKIIDDWLADPIWDKYYWRCCERIPVRKLLKDGSDEVDGVGDHTAGFLDAQ